MGIKKENLKENLINTYNKVAEKEKTNKKEAFELVSKVSKQLDYRMQQSFYNSSPNDETTNEGNNDVSVSNGNSSANASNDTSIKSSVKNIVEPF